MNWRDAFLRQARSDDRVRRLLAASDVEYCHALHYLQMTSEKLAKGLLTQLGSSTPPPTTHSALVRLLQNVKTQRVFRDYLGYKDARVLRALIDSLLPLAARLEALAPSAAGLRQPNPEYPWLPPSGQVIAPADFAFSTFDPRLASMIEFEKLLSQLLVFGRPTPSYS